MALAVQPTLGYRSALILCITDDDVMVMSEDNNE